MADEKWQVTVEGRDGFRTTGKVKMVRRRIIVVQVKLQEYTFSRATGVGLGNDWWLAQVDAIRFAPQADDVMGDVRKCGW